MSSIVTAAQYNVGASYAGGTGVQKSDVDAAKWFRRAADQGVVFAQLNLGLLYAAGNGVPQDSVEALKWYTLAASGPSPQIFSLSRNRLSGELTDQQKAEAARRAAEWKPVRER